MNNQATEPRELTEYELCYGRNEAPPQATSLHAGPVTALWEGGDLRDVRLGGVELLRRAYVSVRDENWDTIPAQMAHVSTDLPQDSFIISYDAKNVSRSLEFDWRGTITGEPNGTVTLAMTGQAKRDFLYSRIGFCLLHPLAEYCGQPYQGHGPEGVVGGNLPDLIAPQRYEKGLYWPLFPSVSRLEVTLKSGLLVRFAFEGDLFEMEDQRNWTDGSFKTYCTPLSLGYPHQARTGQTFAQKVSLTVEGGREQKTQQDSRIHLDLGASLRRPLPQIGLGTASHEVALSTREADLLSRLHLDHLRVDLHLGQSSAGERLARAERECSQLGCGVELAVFLTDDAEQELQSLASRLPSSVPIARVLVFHEKEPTTSAKWIAIARQALTPCLPQVPICGGTNLYFAELNRFRPEIGAVDAVAYSINPQVHASDERSLVENLEGQADTVATAQSFCSDLPVVVSPVTLKPRFNPDAIGPEPPPLPGELPSAVDARQMSLFAAAWTVGSIKQLAEAGAASLTYYETTGWRGLIESDQGCLAPDRFRSSPGMVFPAYHVFADLVDARAGGLVKCQSSDPLKVQGLAVQTENGLRILVANLTAEPQECRVAPLPGRCGQIRALDVSNAPLAMNDPQEFRHGWKRREIPAGDAILILELPPYSVVRIDSAKN